jgi:hypothetical protein
MTDRPLLVLCDDEPKVARGWCEDLTALDEVSSAFEIAIVDKAQFEEHVKRLEERRSSLRDGRTPSSDETIFDAAAILIVDYDLYGYKPDQLLTGDSIAYLARAFSRCGYVVGVNQDRIANPFDLTLVAHRAAATDLSIGSDQVADPGLWSADPTRWRAFRPWSWPVLPERAAAFHYLASRLEGVLDDDLASVLALPREILDSLPRSVLALLDVPGRSDLGAVPLRDWVSGSQMGIRSGDKLSDDEQVARVAAARVSKWFERVLLPGQDVLVDAPHLADRRPGLLEGDSASPDAWASTTRLAADAGAAGLRSDRISDYAFGDGWLSRPVWLWPRIASDADLDDTLDAPRPKPRIVFAEDSSRFVPADAATRYTADVEPPFNSRFLALPERGAGYLPAARLVS